VVLLAESLRSDAEFDVRLAAAKGLGETKNAAAQAALGEALSDPDPAMQYQAIVSLQEATGKDFGNSIERGQQYVKGETPQPAPSLAERFFKLF
jgi:HEAT repeat protein